MKVYLELCNMLEHEHALKSETDNAHAIIFAFLLDLFRRKKIKVVGFDKYERTFVLQFSKKELVGRYNKFMRYG